MEAEGDLKEQLRSLLEEARMVIPGVQALMGFQLVVVFNPLFPKSLSETQQSRHLISLGLTTLAMILIMSPASHHRLAGHVVTERLVRYSARFLLCGMGILAAGICLDVQLIAYVILGHEQASVFLALGLGLLFGFQWFAFPMLWSHSSK